MSKYLITIILIIASQISVFSQTDTVKIKTSAVCNTCKKTIEESLSFEKGIKKSSLDLETKVITVIYNPSKTNAEKIRMVELAFIIYDSFKDKIFTFLGSTRMINIQKIEESEYTGSRYKCWILCAGTHF